MEDRTDPRSMKHKLLDRWGQLKVDITPYLDVCQDISKFLMPSCGRYFVTDNNRNFKRNGSIHDNAATRANRILGAGMMAGATSPARPWFRLTTSDPELAKNHEAKVWLNNIAQMMQRVFQKSNTYRVLHGLYEELGAFGTGCSIVMPDFNNVVHHYKYTVGEFAVAANFKGEIDTLYREFQRPVSQVVKEFGYKNCSQSTRDAFDRGNLNNWVRIIHAIEPREDRNITKRDNKNMPWGSYYFEGGDENKDTFLRESGFEMFPGLVPRWSVEGGDDYGTSPGNDCLGFIKQLQAEQINKGHGINYQTRPPLQVPMNLKGREVDTLPGGLTFYDPSSPSGGVKSLFEVQLNLEHLLIDINDIRQQISSTFYADLFLMLANATDTRMTATEVAERHEEKLLMLGPVLERLHNELLSPLIDITFNRMLKAGIIPKPPEAMNGQEISVEFVSMLAQAQRAIGANSIDKFVVSLGGVAQVKPDVLDKFDSDEWVNIYADITGVDPNLIVADDKVAIIRQNRAAQQQQAEQLQAAQIQSQTAKNLAQAPLNGGNALEGALSQYSGYS